MAPAQRAVTAPSISKGEPWIGVAPLFKYLDSGQEGVGSLMVGHLARQRRSSQVVLFDYDLVLLVSPGSP
eukprot:13232747-Alexandrium_andersonii.AAC.1